MSHSELPVESGVSALNPESEVLSVKPRWILLLMSQLMGINVITGLQGSGKFNSLNAICFGLLITNHFVFVESGHETRQISYMIVEANGSKENKLSEMNKIFRDELGPKLTKLEEEHQQ